MMKVKKFLGVYDEKVMPLYEAPIFYIELEDGSLLLIRDDTGSTNSVNISASGSVKQRLGISEGLAIVPQSCNSINLFSTPLGEPETRKYND